MRYVQYAYASRDRTELGARPITLTIGWTTSEPTDPGWVDLEISEKDARRLREYLDAVLGDR